MSFTGHVIDGQIVLDGGIVLPNGTPVRVESLASADVKCLDSPQASEPKTLAEVLKGFIGCVDDLPEDAALNHDHYLYGGPKQYPDRPRKP